MKKAVILFALFSILLSACSLIAPDNPPSQPISKPDPCAADLIMEGFDTIQSAVSNFQDLVYISHFTPKSQMISLVLKLQEIRHELQDSEIPDCHEASRNASILYMNSVIQYLSRFMSGETPDNFYTDIYNSQVMWTSVLEEMNAVKIQAGLEPDEVPDISSLLPQGLDETVFVINNGTSSVNVRAQPYIEADIIASLESNTQAIGLGKSAAGDWIQVNQNGLIGWVFTDTVTLSLPVEDLPVIN